MNPGIVLFAILAIPLAAGASRLRLAGGEPWRRLTCAHLSLC